METEKKPFKSKRITLILVIIIVLFLGGNAIAALVGAPNIFFAIKDSTKQEEITDKEKLLYNHEKENNKVAVNEEDANTEVEDDKKDTDVNEVEEEIKAEKDVESKKTKETKDKNALEEDDDEITEAKQSKAETKTITKDDVTVTYTSKIERELSKGEAKYIYKNWIPKIEGLKASVSSEIENQIKEFYKESVEQDLKDNEEDYIIEILTNQSDSEIQLGFDVIYELEYVNDNVVTFKRCFTGSLGGVPWDATSGISFNKETGKIITLEDIVTDKIEYTKIVKESIMEQLKEDERFSTLDEEYEKVIDDIAEYSDDTEMYLNETGCVYIIPKYAITAGAAGEFKVIVEYEDMEDCINIDNIK